MPVRKTDAKKCTCRARLYDQSECNVHNKQPGESELVIPNILSARLRIPTNCGLFIGR